VAIGLDRSNLEIGPINRMAAHHSVFII